MRQEDGGQLSQAGGHVSVGVRHRPGHWCIPTPTRDLTIGQRATLYTVLETGNVKEAARRLGVAEPTIRTALARAHVRAGLATVAQLAYWQGRADGQEAERRRATRSGSASLRGGPEGEGAPAITSAGAPASPLATRVRRL
jgi:hypothetical protein